MKTKILIPLLSLLIAIASFGQGTASKGEGPTVPKAEIAFGYSFINGHPNFPQITSYNINGGGAAFLYNVKPLILVKPGFIDYTGGGGYVPRTVSYTGTLSGD